MHLVQSTTFSHFSGPPYRLSGEPQQQNGRGILKVIWSFPLQSGLSTDGFHSARNHRQKKKNQIKNRCIDALVLYQACLDMWIHIWNEVVATSRLMQWLSATSVSAAPKLFVCFNNFTLMVLISFLNLLKDFILPQVSEIMKFDRAKVCHLVKAFWWIFYISALITKNRAFTAWTFHHIVTCTFLERFRFKIQDDSLFTSHYTSRYIYIY